MFTCFDCRRGLRFCRDRLSGTRPLPSKWGRGWGGSGGRCFWSGGDLSVRALRTDLHDGDLRPRLHRLAFFGEDLPKDAGHRRRHLGIDLVGINLEHRLELDDPVAWFDEPFRDRPFMNRLPKLWHDDAGGLSSHQYAARSLNTFVILSGVGMKNSSIGMA